MTKLNYGKVAKEQAIARHTKPPPPSDERAIDYIYERLVRLGYAGTRPHSLETARKLLTEFDTGAPAATDQPKFDAEGYRRISEKVHFERVERLLRAGDENLTRGTDEIERKLSEDLEQNLALIDGAALDETSEGELRASVLAEYARIRKQLGY